MVDRANRPSALNAPQSSGPSAQVDIIGEGGSQKVVASLPSGESVEVYLFGATVTSWKSNGGQTENLWVSEAADLTGNKPIRGGVPVVFPVCPAPEYSTNTWWQGSIANRVLELRPTSCDWGLLQALSARLRTQLALGILGQVVYRRCARH
jgi:hypothetical protein